MPLNGLKILLAEDNPTNQMVAVQMLESLGAEVTLAVDGVEALEMAERETFDVGLIDIEMPRLSGTDVIRRLRRQGGGASTMPLIALTAYVMREHRIAIDEAGADGVIAKPILSIEQLGEEIAEIVRRRSSGERGPRAADTAPTRATPRVPPRPRLAGPVDLEVFGALGASIGAESMQRLLGKVDGDLVRTEGQIRNGLEHDDTRTVRDATHVLVAVAGAVGAQKLQGLAQCLNSAAHSGDRNGMVELGRETLGEIAEILRFIRGRGQD